MLLPPHGTPSRAALRRCVKSRDLQCCRDPVTHEAAGPTPQAVLPQPLQPDRSGPITHIHTRSNPDPTEQTSHALVLLAMSSSFSLTSDPSPPPLPRPLPHSRLLGPRRDGGHPVALLSLVHLVSLLDASQEVGIHPPLSLPLTAFSRSRPLSVTRGAHGARPGESYRLSDRSSIVYSTSPRSRSRDRIRARLVCSCVPCCP